MTISIHQGDCREVLATLPADSVDAIVTDPPYHVFVSNKGSNTQHSAFARLTEGFTGKSWDEGQVAFEPATWAAALRVLKPGGHMFAFAAARLSHRMALAIEDAGFEIRDCFQWMYSSGFPKSLDISKSVDRMLGFEREQVSPSANPLHLTDSMDPISPEAHQWEGWGTTVKPAFEPVYLARKPLSEKSITANVLRWGTGALNIAGCKTNGYWPANVMHDGSDQVLSVFPPGTDRFFFSGKAKPEDRAGSKHPTVKPVALIRYLVRLITPPGGTVMDIFSGSGTTGQAALEEGFSAVLIEREDQYFADIRRRFGIADDAGIGFDDNAGIDF